MFWFATEPVFHSSVHEGAFHSLHARRGCTKGCLFPSLQVYGIHKQLPFGGQP